jgi:hypothetical protein
MKKIRILVDIITITLSVIQILFYLRYFEYYDNNSNLENIRLNLDNHPSCTLSNYFHHYITIHNIEVIFWIALIYYVCHEFTLMVLVYIYNLNALPVVPLAPPINQEAASKLEDISIIGTIITELLTDNMAFYIIIITLVLLLQFLYKRLKIIRVVIIINITIIYFFIFFIFIDYII